MENKEYPFNPSLDEVMFLLKQKDEYKNIKTDFEKLRLILYYFEENQTEVFFRKISSMNSKDDISILFENLCYLYPLSKYILMKMMEKHPLNKDYQLTGDFFDIYERGEGLLRAYRETVSEIKNLRSGIGGSMRIKKCEEHISEYEEEKEKSKSIIQEIKEKEAKENVLAKEVEALQKEVEDLQSYYSDNKLADKKKELMGIKSNLEKNKTEYSEAAEEIKKLIKEIDRYSKDAYQKNLMELSDNSKILSDNEEI